MTYSINDLNTVDYGNLTFGGYNGTSNTDFSFATTSYNHDPLHIHSRPGGSGKLVIQGENADIDINGTSLKDFMHRVEQRLEILTPNLKLEKEFEELKELGNQYRKLEKEIQDRMKTWDILKIEK